MKTPGDMFFGNIFETNNFGKVKILEYRGWLDVDVEFINSGSVRVVRAGDIRRGNVKDFMQPTMCGVGFLGVGHYPVRSGDGKLAESYIKWCSMIYRCYCDAYHKDYPTYIDCEVCEEWKEFQAFAEWYEENKPQAIGEYHLDKDIKIKGNKIYSPDACLVVTALENIIESSAKCYKFINSSGIEFDIFNLKAFCDKHNLIPQCMGQVAKGNRKHHKGWRIAAVIE